MYGSTTLIYNSSIDSNIAQRYGGIRCRSNTYMVVEDCIIDGNSAANYGGGINSTTSEINIINSVISNNSANNGGGIYMYSSISTLVSVDILYNAASSVGGGLALENTSPELSNVNIKYNEADYGGGIDCFSKSNPNLENVLIANNIAYRNGGGIRFNDKSLPYFSEDVRCSIFLNAASLGSDICSSDIDTIIQIKLDTFTVFSPHTYLAFPIENYEFDILNAKVQQITDDLYISPDGDNNNSGLTADQPLKNLWYAFMMVQPDSINPQTFYLANGTYSTSATNEIFPVNLVSHLTLQGESAETVILDAEDNAGVIRSANVRNAGFNNMTITGGNSDNGGGFYCLGSEVSINDITVIDNEAHSGGGIDCDQSELELSNVTLTNNRSSRYPSSNDIGGGAMRVNNSDLVMENVIISKNDSYAHGGGILFLENCNPVFKNVTISSNFSNHEGGGIYFHENCHPQEQY